MKTKNKFISALVSTAIVVTSICPTFASAQAVDVAQDESSVNAAATVDAETSEITVSPGTGIEAEADDNVKVEIPSRAKVVGDKTITIHLNGGTLDTDYIEAVNTVKYDTYEVIPDTSTLSTRVDGDTVYIYTKNKESVIIPSPEKSGSLFVGYFEDGDNNFDSVDGKLILTNDIDEYTLNAEFGEADPLVLSQDVLCEEFSTYSLLSRAMTTFGLNPYSRATTYSRQDFLYGVDYSAETTGGGNKYVFTAPYDGDYIFSAYGANGGISYGVNRYQSDQLVGFGGKASGTITMKAGQTATFFFGEEGRGGDAGVSDSNYYRNRTYGGGGCQIPVREAWVEAEYYGIYDRYHVYGRGGGATYVSLDGYDITQHTSEFSAFDYTNAEHTKNVNYSKSVEPHILVMAGGGGGTGSGDKGGNGGGYDGQARHIGQYYIGTKIVGNYNYNGNYALVDSDRTDVLDTLVDQSTHRLTEKARIEAQEFPATQNTAGFGLHYTILGEAVDRVFPENDPIKKAAPEGAKRTWGSFYYGANACACSGGGGGGWFGGGSDFGIGAGGGSSYAKEHTINTAEGGTVTVKNVSTKAGANAPVKYGGENTTGKAANLCAGHVTVTLVGETAKLASALQKSSNNTTASKHTYPNDAYGQQMSSTGTANTYTNGNTAVYEAYVYTKPSDGSTPISPVWQIRTRGSSTWTNVPSSSTYKTTTKDLGVETSGTYKGYRKYSVTLTINVTDSLLPMGSIRNFFFRLVTTSKVRNFTLSSTTIEAPFNIEYKSSMKHMGVNKYYNGKNVINNSTVTDDTGISNAIKNQSYSVWKYPNLDISNGGTMKAFVVTIGGNASNRVDYNFNGYSGVTLLKDEGAKKRTFYAANGMTEAQWEDFLRNHVSFVVYDKLFEGTSGGAPVTWVGYKSCGTMIPDGLSKITFKDGSTHYYKGMLFSEKDSYASSRSPGPSYLMSSKNIYYAVADSKKESKKINGVTGHVVTLNNEEEYKAVVNLPFSPNKMVGLIPFHGGYEYHSTTTYVWQTDLEAIGSGNMYTGINRIVSNRSAYTGYIEMLRPSRSGDGSHSNYGEDVEWTDYSGVWGAYQSYVNRIYLPYHNWVNEYACSGRHSVISQRGYFIVGPHGPNNARGWEDDAWGYLQGSDDFVRTSSNVQYAGMQFRKIGWPDALVTAGFDYTGDYDCPYGDSMGYILEFDSLPPSEPTDEQCRDTDVIGTNTSIEPAKKELGTVTGKVWIETDGNGIFEASSDAAASIPGLKLNVYNSSNTLVKTITPDANGDYVAGALPEGTYYVTANVSSYGSNSKNYGIDSSEKEVNVFAAGKSPTFYVPSGGSQTGINCAIFVGSTVEGYVYSDSNNFGYQNGQPGLAGVRVTLKDGAGNALTGVNYATTTTTDGNGHYSFAGLPEGSYTVVYNTSDKSDAKVAKILPESTNYNSAANGLGESSNRLYNNATGQYSKNQNSLSGSSSLEYASVLVSVLSAGANNGNKVTSWSSAPRYYRNCGLVLNADNFFIRGIIWHDTNGDGIKQADETPLSGIKVTLADTNFDQIESEYDSFKVSSQTGADGQYTLYCEKGESYTVLVSDREILGSSVEYSISDFVATKYVGGTGNVGKDIPTLSDRNIVYGAVSNVQGPVIANIGIIQKSTLDAKFVNNSTTAGTRYGTNVFKGGEYGELVITITGDVKTTSIDYDSILKQAQAAAKNAGVYVDGNLDPTSFGPDVMTNNSQPVGPGQAQSHSYEYRIPINVPTQVIDLASFTDGETTQTGTVSATFANAEVITKNPPLKILDETATQNDLFHTILG